jgi:hypothetical protein
MRNVAVTSEVVAVRLVPAFHCHQKLVAVAHHLTRHCHFQPSLVLGEETSWVGSHPFNRFLHHQIPSTTDPESST